MDKKIVIGIIIGILVIGSGLFLGAKRFFKEREPGLQTIANIEKYKTAENVVVDLTLSQDKKEVVLTISDLAGYKSLEYELSYDTDKGPKGTLSGSKPLSLDGQDQFVRTVTLGTCSKNVCTYDEGVRNISVVIKLYPQNGDPQIFKKSFDI